MQNPNNLAARIENLTEPTEPPRRSWQVEVSQLLTNAALLCIQEGVDLDAYMTGAWAAYVEARPGLRAHLEELHLRDQLEELRKLGRVGAA